ncbi:hypothetical protein VT84_16565 [Gemmata sp. SH-PL17]|uniref:transposase n=1 Tax=Gemmata sp. SH-PL17 TaxID=1630693 RepID=UPI00078D3996|nr:transposase [Gemmata sp. SH-PL17]AMV26014.1 hypothetical protein VT84_16565 [Gemmata sp. SH-PL17]
MGTTRKPYPTDLTDARWERLEPLIPKPKSGTKKGGRRAVDRRELVSAIFYHLRGGLSWELLPHDFPHFKTVFHHLTAWRKSGLREHMHARLRADVRVGAGHPPEPQTERIDNPTVKTTRTPGDRGYDGKKGQGAQAVHSGGLARAHLGLVGDDRRSAGSGRGLQGARTMNP